MILGDDRGDFVRRLELGPLDPRLTVDAHAQLHLVVTDA